MTASRHRVFAAWADVDQLAIWWWPRLGGTTYDVDARTGGRFRTSSPAIGATVSGGLHRGRPPTSTAYVPEGGAERGWNDVMDRLVLLCENESQSTSSRS